MIAVMLCRDETTLRPKSAPVSSSKRKHAGSWTAQTTAAATRSDREADRAENLPV